MIHELKIWTEYFDAVVTGLKTFEIRKNDRNFKIGDVLKLNEYNPTKHKYTKVYVKKTISYILKSDLIIPDYVILGLIDKGE